MPVSFRLVSGWIQVDGVLSRHKIQALRLGRDHGGVVMRNIVAGAARAAKRCRFALPGAYLAAVLGVCNPHVVYGTEAEEPVVEVVVTGSRLGSANVSSPSPIVVLDSEELLHQGTPRATST
jgi:hypothetical protein